jgi:hypothetical protein
MLESQITYKATPGTEVRATTAFPVTVGSQQLIPVGTFVQGVIDKVSKRDASGFPRVFMHFTRLVFPNGYAVSLDHATSSAVNLSPGPALAENFTPETGPAFAAAAGQATTATPPPQLPPLPGPSYGTILGITAGVAAAGLVALVLIAHHNGGGNYLLYTAGWQFEMVLDNPVSVDMDKANADPSAVATP